MMDKKIPQMLKNKLVSNRVYNFGAGPAMLPDEILLEAKDELLNWHNQGMSILEIGHRTPEFSELLNHAEQSLRELLNIPNDYRVIFFGGAARTHFATIPMNFLYPHENAGYLVSGQWSQMALEEAQKLKNAYCVASGESGGFTSISDQNTWTIKENTKYIYYTPNETVNGIRCPYVPQIPGIPLIADMTSCLLGEPIDVSQYGLIFAGAQKNIANAGLTVVIVHDDLLKRPPNPSVATMLDYKIQAEQKSLFATPPVFNCYLADKMFTWIKKQGGVEALYQQNCLKAEKLYQYIDSTDFYSTQVSDQYRSIMNVCFKLQKPELEKEFVSRATQCGLNSLQGHRLVGGLRASLYNPMPLAGVEALIEFMMEFAEEHHD
jgi:phosphoserine aminotransferase